MRSLDPAKWLGKVQPNGCNAKKTSKLTNIVMCVRMIMRDVNYRMDYKYFLLSHSSKPKFTLRAYFVSKVL